MRANSPGVYVILNKISGRRYIGSSRRVISRINSHISNLKASRHRNKELQKDFNNMGLEAFSFSVLAYGSLQKISKVEMETIDLSDNLYNIRNNSYLRVL